MRIVLALVVSLLAFAVGGPAAHAATGDLTWAGCVANGGAAGCVDPPKDSLTGAGEVAVSPDGQSVYAAGVESSSINHFRRSAGGSVEYIDCIADIGQNDCGDPGQDALLSAERVVTSPDGASVYVTAATADSINHFLRAADGSLTYAGCIADEGKNFCTDPSIDALDNPRDLAISPDGASVYVVSRSDHAVNEFRVLPGGGLEFAGCIGEDGENGCTNPPQDALEGANSVVVSPDGQSVYVGSDDEAINHFERNAAGALFYRGCIGDGGAGGQCTDPPKDAFAGSLALAVSPDGDNLYAAAAGGNSVTSFRVLPGGALEYMDCIADEGAFGCADPPQDPFDDILGIVVSPDGLSVYATAIDENSISHLARAGDGALTFQGCVADAGLNGCADPPVDSLNGAYSVAISPDGTSVYVGAYAGASVTHLTREVPDSIAPETRFAKKPKSKLKTKRKRAKAKFKLRADEPGVTFECKLDKKAFAPCDASLKLRVKLGKHTFAARAVDAAGNADPTPVRAKFKVKRRRR